MSKWSKRTELIKMERKMARHFAESQSPREEVAHFGRHNYAKVEKHLNKCRKTWGFENPKSYKI